ncbi:MAG: UTP--glucose-1-phosphate uridylyltransferase GalU [bacterium]
MTVKKVVIPAAGMGTRFLPATKAVPKEMLPLVDKPVIQEVVEEAVRSGISEIVLITGMGKGAIEDHFDISTDLEGFLASRGQEELLKMVRDISRMVDIISVRQKEPRGLGHAVLCAKAAVGDEPFAVMLGDDVVDSEVPCIAQLLKVFEKYNSTVVALEFVPDSDVDKYGIVEGEEVEPGIVKIKNLVEKPPLKDAPSNLAVIGRYILTPEIFSAIEGLAPDDRGEIQLTNALQDIANSDEVYGVVFEGTRYDAGNRFGFLVANIVYALKDGELGPQLREYLKGLVAFWSDR